MSLEEFTVAGLMVKWILLGKVFWVVNTWRAPVQKQLKWLTLDFVCIFLTRWMKGVLWKNIEKQNTNLFLFIQWETKFMKVKQLTCKTNLVHWYTLHFYVLMSQQNVLEAWKYQKHKNTFKDGNIFYCKNWPNKFPDPCVLHLLFQMVYN